MYPVNVFQDFILLTSYMWEVALLRGAYSELFIFIVFKNNSRVKINKIMTLSYHIFILLLFSEKEACICVSKVFK